MGLEITAINQFPAVPAGTGTWNPNKAMQPWFDAAIGAQLAADPTLADDLAVYTTWRVNFSTGAVSTYQFGIPYSQAAVSNVPPANYASTPNAPQVIMSPNNNPIDLSQLKAGGKYAGYTIGNVSPLNPVPPLVPPAGTADPVPPGTDPTEARILAGEEELLKNAGLPLV